MQFSLDAWRDHVSVFYEVEPLVDPRSFSAAVSFCRQRDLILTKASFPAQCFDHNPKAIKGIDHGYLLFERYLEGRGRGLVDETSTKIDRGRIHLVDMSRRYRTVVSKVATQGVIIPHDTIGYDPSADPAYVSTDRSMPEARLLELAHASFCRAAETEADSAPHLAATFVSLVQRLLLGQPDRRSESQRVRDRLTILKAYITRHLDDLELSTEHLCRVFGLSRSSLYRLFEQHGGVARYISDRRLDRCFADLLAARRKRGQVRRVAERWGFFQPGNFHRRFRERFDLAPSECIGSSSALVPRERSTGWPVHEWLRKV